MKYTSVPVCSLYPSEVPSLPAIPLFFMVMTCPYRQLSPFSYHLPERPSWCAGTVLCKNSSITLQPCSPSSPPFSSLSPLQQLDSKYYALTTQLTFQLPSQSRNLNPSRHISCTVVMDIHRDWEV